MLCSQLDMPMNICDVVSQVGQTSGQLSVVALFDCCCWLLL